MDNMSKAGPIASISKKSPDSLKKLGEPNACHHQAAEGCRHRGYPLVAALVNGIVSGHLCGPASTLGGVHDEQVQRQLFHFHPVDTQAQKGSP